MKVGDRIKWRSQDENGEFVTVGKVYAINDKFVWFFAEGLQMSVPLTDGTFEVTNVATTTEVKVAAEAAITKAKAAVRTGTKLEQAVDIYKGMKDATRQKLIKAFVDQLEMTTAGASTYAAKVRKIK